MDLEPPSILKSPKPKPKTKKYYAVIIVIEPLTTTTTPNLLNSNDYSKITQTIFSTLYKSSDDSFSVKPLKSKIQVKKKKFIFKKFKIVKIVKIAKI